MDECKSLTHGPNLERLRTLQGDFSPEMGLYVRLARRLLRTSTGPTLNLLLLLHESV